MFRVDAHFDLLCFVYEKRAKGETRVIEKYFYEDWLKNNFNIIVSSIFIDSIFIPEMALRNALDQISCLYEEIAETPEKIMLCKNYIDIEKAEKEKKIGILMSLEGSEPIGNDLFLLRTFYELGVRFIGLAWNRRTYCTDGIPVCKDVRKQYGLTDLGIDVLAKAKELGMIVDVSHLTDQGFEDVMTFYDMPVIASHSNCRSLTGHLRNLTDEQMKKIAQRGGVVGINSFSLFLNMEPLKASISDMAEHMNHMRNIMGTDHIGLGFDFCSHIRSSLYESEEKDKFDAMNGYNEFFILDKELSKKGFSQDEREKVYSKNFLRLYNQILQ